VCVCVTHKSYVLSMMALYLLPCVFVDVCVCVHG